MPDAASLVLVAATFLLAGWVKGVVGMGLPLVVMGALGLVMAPVQAAALLVVPALVTNVWQFLAGPARRSVTRRLLVMMLFVCIGTFPGIQFMTSGTSKWPSFVLGIVLALYAVTALFMPQLRVPARHEKSLSPLVGGVTGLLTGATGLSSVPSVPYLSALGLSKDELVQALGLTFAVSTLALGVALGATGHYDRNAMLASTGALLPALLGMFLGQLVRDRLDPVIFRRWFFSAMLAVGATMALKALGTG